MSDKHGYDTKGSRKALGAMNAKLRAKVGRLEREIAELLEALEVACEVLDNVRGDINPERGYADELEAEVSQAYDTTKAALGDGGKV